jgi:hypothetical protein
VSSQQIGIGSGTRTELRSSNTLQSWKEIATYLQRGVRTAQRWERDAGLPVRRPRGGDRGPVFAFPEELDAWMRSRRNYSLVDVIPTSSRPVSRANTNE